jgi:hypothetical protein
MKTIFTSDDLNTMHVREDRKRETCLSDAEDRMKNAKLSFDDVECINDHYENHKWGSNADRAYKKRAVKQAMRKVAANPEQYATI